MRLYNIRPVNHTERTLSFIFHSGDWSLSAGYFNVVFLSLNVECHQLVDTF